MEPVGEVLQCCLCEKYPHFKDDPAYVRVLHAHHIYEYVLGVPFLFRLSIYDH